MPALQKKGKNKLYAYFTLRKEFCSSRPMGMEMSEIQPFVLGCVMLSFSCTFGYLGNK